jgi:extracellular matrix regulatory protein A
LKLLNVGFGNVVVASRVIAIVSPSSAPIKRLKDSAKREGKLVDATQGRRTRAIIVTDSDHIILSGVQAETMAQRLEESMQGQSQNN